MTRQSGPLTHVSGPRFQLRPSVEAFVDRDGRLCMVRPGDDDLVVRKPDSADIAVVDALRHGWATVDDLACRLDLADSVIRTKLESLVAADLLLVSTRPAEPELGADEAERFSRQLPYLAEFGDEVRLQRRLRDSTATVIGCGGLGTWAIAALACIGVGRMVLIDDDHVALSNLNRQILYAPDDLGTAKVTAAADWIRAFDPEIQVRTVQRRVASAEEAARHVAGTDAVVLVADWPPYEIARWVNAACVEARVPFIVAGQLPPLVKIGPTYLFGDGPCFSCHENALARASAAYEDYVAFRSAQPTTAATIGPASCVVGGLLGLELLHLLIGQVPATAGAAILMDMRTLAVRHESVDRDPDCVACKHLDHAGRRGSATDS